MATVMAREIMVEKRIEEATAPEITAPPVEEALPANPKSAKISAPVRLAALDAFRGLTILLMLLVNNVALDEATPRHLTHAEWSGRVHLADIVFPWFLLAVGVAIPFAVASHRRKGVSWLGYFGKSIKRTISLLALGWLVDSTINHSLTIGLGVLQVIGLAYFVAALLSPLKNQWRALLAIVFLVAHSAILLIWHVPGLGPGRITEDANAIAFLNEIYLAPWGLKGLVSVIPTAAMVLIGTVFGDLFRQASLPLLRRAGIAAVSGTTLLLIGLGLSTFLPMNKPLWTAPYIIYTAGMGIMLLAALHVAVDGTKYGQKLAFPLTVPGSNAITAYVAPILVKLNILQAWIVPGAIVATNAKPTLEAFLQAWCYNTAGRINGGWLYTFGYIAFWWLILFYLYRKQWFLRV